MAKDFFKQRVREVMAKDVVYVDPEDTINDALSLLVENKVSAVPVVDGHNHAVGVLSATDLLGLAREMGEEISELAHSDEETSVWMQLLSDKDLGAALVKEYMTADVITIDPEATLVDAAREMARNRIHRLVVTAKDRTVVGILSTMDILNALAHAAPRGLGSASPG